MQILEDIYIVGGGEYGIGISNRLDCNVYLIDGGDDAVLIDSGVGQDTQKIIDNISSININKEKISKLILTHAHLDHSGGARDLKKILGLEIFISKIEARYMEKGDEESIGLNIAKKSGIYPGNFKLKPVKIDSALSGNEIIKVGKYNLKIINTPGHSTGSICILLENHSKKVLFSGDTVFIRGLLCMLNLPDSSLKDYKIGIDNLSKYKIDSLLPSHYGFTLGYGKKHIEMAKTALQSLSIPPMT